VRTAKPSTSAPTIENGHDCDDTDPAVTHLAVVYPDEDGDGVGAPPGRSCASASPRLPALPAAATIKIDDDDDLGLLLGI
jgi:hypothetical protein